MKEQQSDDLTMSVKMNNKSFEGLKQLAKGELFCAVGLDEVLDFVDRRYDCADFRMISLLRLLYDYADRLPEETVARIRQSVLGFKYWMDEPGEDSMCYWSENHQLIFATCEYLAGQRYPDARFVNDGRSGLQHMREAEGRLMRWFDSRLKLGFVEWHSNTYYEEDVAPLSLLIDCCRDQMIVKRATLLMDLLLMDMAMHSFRGYMAASSGRCYEKQKQDPRLQDVGDILQQAFGIPAQEPDCRRLSADFLINRGYQVPEALRQIARDEATAEIRTSMGLDLPEVAAHFPDPQDIDGRGMYLWSMEAFSNPESVDLTLRIFRKWKLKHNIFLKNLKHMDLPVLKQLRLMPLMIRLLNPVTQGIAIQRANTLTRRTKHYMLSCAQQYHPGGFGDQQHIWQATLPGPVSVFTTHPGASFFEDNARNFSPSYWVGNGVNPHANQHGNVLLCLYDLRARRGLMEKKRQLFTHAWFPRAQMDACSLAPRLALARKGDSYIALLSLHPMELKGDSELIQRGRLTGWAALLGSVDEHGSFDAFARLAREAVLSRSKKGLLLIAQGQRYEIVYRRHFLVDEKIQPTDYPRIDSPWTQVPREGKQYSLRCKGHWLKLDGEGWTRSMGREDQR